MMRLAPRLVTGLVVASVLAVLAAPAAWGATSSWQFSTPSFNYGPAIAGGGPIEQAFTLVNTGETPLRIKRRGTSWGGSEAELFKIKSSTCGTIQPGTSCTVTVAFSPTTMGTKEGSMHVETETESEESLRASVSLRGEGVAAQVVIEPSIVSFGSAEVGVASPSQTITVANASPLTMVLKSAYVADLLGAPEAPSPYSITADGCSGTRLPGGGSCLIQVALTPVRPGEVLSDLEVTDALPEPLGSVELSGNAVAATPAPLPLITPPKATPKPKRKPLTCPRSKRKVVRKGKQICVRRHHHRSSGPATR